MSLFAEYFKERLGRETLERDWGFIIYELGLDEVCFIHELYVKPEFRKKGLGSQLADDISDVAQSKGCKSLACQVWPKASGSTDALKAILSYGFELYSVLGDAIILKKHLGG